MLGQIGSGELLVVLVLGMVGFLTTLFWLWMLIECATKEPSEGSDKIVWVLIILFTHLLGAAIYFFVRRPQRVEQQSLDPRLVAIMAVMTAIIFVLTRMVQIPTPAKGYIHLGDTAIFFAAFAFGPWVGGIAGGLGTALADITSGYPQWAIFSFLVHGFQGWLVGAMVRRETGWYRLLTAVGAGSAVVVVGYFIAGTILMGMGAAVSEIPANIIQALSGGLVGAPLYLAVRRAYPPLAQR